MKKFFKRLIILILVAVIAVGAIFHKRILLGYGIAEKYISLKDEIPNTKNVDITSISNSMNYKDIVYKDTNGVKLTLDIYSPLKNVYKKSPVILYVHGGSWVYGDKSLPEVLTPVLDTFRDQGYTIISTSYELMRNKEDFNKQVCDVKDTIRWIYKNADTYNFDTDEIGMIGFSSGAHLSLMAAYSPNDDFTDDTSLSSYPSKVKYLVDFAGPTDLSLLNTTNLNFDLNKVFSSVRNRESVINKFNPINYVSKDDPNTLIIHSKSDKTVPFESAEKLYEKCQEENSKAEFIALNNSGHDLSGISSDDIVAISKGLFMFIVSNSPL
ncbi:MAG TPA: lipase [Clostridium sp.]|nr:lipase [Clostridium sp.]